MIFISKKQYRNKIINNSINKIMSLIQSILKRFNTKDIKVLGRWKIETCDKKMNNKIDLSNEDHCGPCGQYILNKTYPYPVPTKKYENKTPIK